MQAFLFRTQAQFQTQARQIPKGMGWSLQRLSATLGEGFGLCLLARRASWRDIRLRDLKIWRTPRPKEEAASTYAHTDRTRGGWSAGPWPVPCRGKPRHTVYVYPYSILLCAAPSESWWNRNCSSQTGRWALRQRSRRAGIAQSVKGISAPSTCLMGSMFLSAQNVDKIADSLPRADPGGAHRGCPWPIASQTFANTAPDNDPANLTASLELPLVALCPRPAQF